MGQVTWMQNLQSSVSNLPRYRSDRIGGGAHFIRGSFSRYRNSCPNGNFIPKAHPSILSYYRDAPVAGYNSPGQTLAVRELSSSGNRHHGNSSMAGEIHLPRPSCLSGGCRDRSCQHQVRFAEQDNG